MIPNRRWFPLSLQERAAWYDNFNIQIQQIGATLTLVPADLTAIAGDNVILQALANIAVELEAYKDAVRQYRIIITEGDIGDPTPAFPDLPVYSKPAGGTTGLFERLDDWVKRIRSAPAYTDQTGALLGILPSSPTPPPLSELKPVIKASESFGGYKFNVDVTRLGMPSFKIEVQKDGSETWQDAAFATSNPVEVTITPTTPGKPERVLVRAVLIKSNEPVGQPSDPTYVTVNP